MKENYIGDSDFEKKKNTVPNLQRSDQFSTKLQWGVDMINQHLVVMCRFWNSLSLSEVAYLTAPDL